jgi:predicted permease
MAFDIRPRIRRAFRLAIRRQDLVDQDVDAELRAHVELRVAQLMARGLTREDAIAEARRRFGESWDDAVRRVRRASHRREKRLAAREHLDALRSDLGYALRTLARQPAFTIVVILTFALGIGANATMFGIIDRMLLRPPPHIAKADRLFELGRKVQFPGGEGVVALHPYPLAVELRKDTMAIEQVGVATYITALTLGTGANAQPVFAIFADGDYFGALGTQPQIGRFFAARNTRDANDERVAVVSHELWQRAFAGDRAALGKSLHIGTRDFTIIGVAPKGFTGADPRRVDVWLPIENASGHRVVSEGWKTDWSANWARMHLRLRTGTTTTPAGARVATVYDAGAATLPTAKSDKPPRRTEFMLQSVLPSEQMKDNLAAKVSRLLMAVAAVVLLIACANVASLLLARGTGRRREIAVRLALGVARGRLLRLVLTETLVLAIAGGGLALVIAQWAMKLLHATLLSDFAWTESALDGRVLATTSVLVVATALVAGLAPTLRAIRPNVVDSLKVGGREGSVAHARARTALVVAQAALSVVLVVGAGLFLQSLRRAVGIRLGYQPDRVIVATMNVFQLGYDHPRRLALYETMRARVAELPGVEAATVSSTHPLQGWGFFVRVRVPGRDSLPRGERPMGPFHNAVVADYFSTLGLRLVEGRPITRRDVDADARVAVLSEAMARAYWPGQRAVDRCIILGTDSTCTTIVGVAEDAKESVTGGAPRFLVYVPMGERWKAGSNTILVRPRGENPRALVEPIRRAMQTAVSDLAFADVQQMRELLSLQIRPWRMGAVLFSLFGALALIIAAVGLYSSVSYTVAQRRHEFGVRMALGARYQDVVRLVVGQGVRAAIVGVVVGSIAAMLAGRFVADLLFQTSPRAPSVYGVVGVLIILVAAAACVVPAWRAARVDPASALRAD